MSWETVIGLEIHAQLSTQSKIFSATSTAYGAQPNTQASSVCLGLPGVLPVLNQAAVEKALQFGLAIEAEIAPHSVFARKNYFYPDLPKGYQISQFELPIVGKGHLSITVDGENKRIGITRAHLEEDAGKSIHDAFDNATGIDLNRAGTPLLEIVSEPDMRSAAEAVAYMKKLHALVRYIGICDGNMQEGSFRCDANVSVRKPGEAFGTRTEIKNLNSFKFIEKAIDYEVARQIDVIEGGGQIVQETRLYDPDKDQTRSMRTKEDANDYRYFPDPDLLPVEITQADLDRARAALPELAEARKTRFMTDFSLSEDDADLLTQTQFAGDYFEKVQQLCQDAKLAANWINGGLGALLNKYDKELPETQVDAANLGAMLNRINDKTISSSAAKSVLEALWNGEGTADEIIEAKGLKQVTDTGAIEKIVDEIIANNPDQVAQYRAGKEKVMGFFVGQTMRASQGKADPAVVNALLKEKLAG